MAEETNTLEEKTLNQEEVKSTYTAEEVEAMKKELQSNTEKGVQKLIREKKEAEETYQTVLNEISMVADNKEHLVRLSEENPKVAKIILDKYYGGQSIEEYKDAIGYEEDLTDPTIIEKKISQEAEKRIRDKQISDKTNEFIAKLEMSDDEKEKFLEAFEERKGLKSFSIETLDKNLEKAYREISDESSISKLKANETIAKAMATGDGK